MIHQRVHPYLDQPDCFGCRIASVSVSADAMPSRRPETAATNARERRWNVDHDAYLRMYRAGGNPAGLDGCAALEKHADHPIELAQMKVMDVPNKQRRIRQGNEMSEDMGMVPHVR